MPRDSFRKDADRTESALGRLDAMLIAGVFVGVGFFAALWTLLMRSERPADSPPEVKSTGSDVQAPPAPATSAPGVHLPADRRPAFPRQPAVSARSHGDEAVVGASEESVRRGFEPLSTNTRALGVTLVVFVLVAGGMLGGLSLLLRHYLAEDRQADPALSAAPVLAAGPPAPLEPMPMHNELDWQDLVHLRQSEDARFRRQGWTINAATGEATVPAAVMVAVRQQYGDRGSRTVEADPLRFPPTLAPVRAGAAASLDRSDVFPPVGSAAAADQLRESIYRPPPGPSDVKDLPTQTGPPDRQNHPMAAPPQ